MSYSTVLGPSELSTLIKYARARVQSLNHYIILILYSNENPVTDFVQHIKTLLIDYVQTF